MFKEYWFGGKPTQNLPSVGPDLPSVNASLGPCLVLIPVLGSLCYCEQRLIPPHDELVTQQQFPRWKEVSFTIIPGRGHYKVM